jgi:hypothetical protein
MDEYRERIDKMFEEENLIYEGLITSHSLEDCIIILNNIKYPTKQKNKKYIVEQNADTNSFFLTHKFDNDYYALDELLELLNLTNNLGWYPTNMTYGSNFKDVVKWDKKQSAIKLLFANDYRTIKFLFEPKFDVRATEYEARLYHLTPTMYVKKILKNGLVPKSRSKKSYHPERIYLSRSLDDAKKLIPKFKELFNIENWTVLMVDTILIYVLHLYKDQNFKDMGYWTLNTITPASLSIYEENNPNTNDSYIRYVNRNEHIQARGIKKKPGDKTPNYEF